MPKTPLYYCKIVYSLESKDSKRAFKKNNILSIETTLKGFVINDLVIDAEKYLSSRIKTKFKVISITLLFQQGNSLV